MSFETENVDGGSGDIFVKIPAGESVTGVIREPVIEYWARFEDKKKIICTKEEGGKFKFTVNFVVKEGDTWVAKILDSGAMIYKQIRELKKAGYTLEDTKFTISRKGTGLNTEYNVIALRQQLTPNEAAEIAQVELHKLEEPKMANAFVSDGRVALNAETDVPLQG